MSWTQQQSSVRSDLLGVWGSDSRSIWAVGDAGSVLYWDGSSWSPRCSGTTQSLLAVWGSSADQVFAAGDNGTLLKWSPSSLARATGSLPRARCTRAGCHLL